MTIGTKPMEREEPPAKPRSTSFDLYDLTEALGAAITAGLGVHLRLAQIIGNAVGGDPYGLENATLVAKIHTYVAAHVASEMEKSDVE